MTKNLFDLYQKFNSYSINLAYSLQSIEQLKRMGDKNFLVGNYIRESKDIINSLRFSLCNIEEALK